MIVYQKARIFDPALPTGGFYVQFNPNTLEYSSGRERKTQKNLGKTGMDKKLSDSDYDHQLPPVGYEWGSTLSVRLFFHSYVNDTIFSDVRPNINRIRAFLPAQQPTSENTDFKNRPANPKITFAWGTIIYTGTLESFHATYQMFAFDGTPVQAEVSITIRGEDQEVKATSVNQILSAVTDTDLSQQDDALFLSSVSWLFQ